MGILDSIFGDSKVKAAKEEWIKLQGQIWAAETRLAEVEKKKADLLEQIKTEALQSVREELDKLTELVERKKETVIELDEKILLQEFSLYQPLYDFMSVAEYEEKLNDIRENQKAMIAADMAVISDKVWTVDGSTAKGRKMVNDMKKLLLRAFNSECEFVTWKVKYNNFDSCKKRIDSTYNTIQKLGKSLNIEISYRYYSLKIEELHLALEYRQAKQREKERQQELREQQREEAALQREIAESRRKIEKEQAHYQQALKAAEKQLEKAVGDERDSFRKKVAQLEDRLREIDKNLEDIDYRETNQRAGYVYVISNIGSFGENVFKIGMTRRLDPMERINELGGASVPFNFDVHALIFSDDAPKLETALHHAFENRKINLVNGRREFFYVGIEEIENVVRANYDKAVEFVKVADAEQFRESKRLRAKFRH